MTSHSLRDRTAALLLAAGIALGFAAFTATHPASAQAQATAAEADEDTADESAPATADETKPAETTSGQKPADTAEIDVNSLDWSQLNLDASTLTYGATAPARRASADDGMKWSSKEKPGGSSVSVKQSVSPFWDTRVGADMTVTREPTTMSELLAEKTTNGGNLPQSGGSAWAAITAPGAGPVWDKTAVEARVNPDTDQSKLGTSISKQVPLNDQTSLTLSNGYNMTQQGMVPVPGMVSRPERTYDTDQSAKVELTETGTSLTAGQTLSTSDDKWLRKIGAEQKLFGGVTVSGSIGETAQGTTNKSVTAGFKKSW